jgi:hypothetical protein
MQHLKHQHLEIGSWVQDKQRAGWKLRLSDGEGTS